MMVPGVGAFELVVIAVVALIVVGPKDLPVMMKKAGQFVGKMRAMASDFRASFEDMARQSELDDLRREVEALRRGAPLDPVRAEIEPEMKRLTTDLEDEFDFARTPSGKRPFEVRSPDEGEAELIEPELAEDEAERRLAAQRPPENPSVATPVPADPGRAEPEDRKS